MNNNEFAIESFISYCDDMMFDINQDIATEGKIKDFFNKQKEKRKQRIEDRNYRREEKIKASNWVGEKYDENSIDEINSVFQEFIEKQIYDVPLEGYTELYNHFLKKQKEIPSNIEADDTYNLTRKELVDYNIEALLSIIEICQMELDKQNHVKTLLIRKYRQTLNHYFGKSLQCANESFIADIS